jgi:hypothetical protein
MKAFNYSGATLFISALLASVAAPAWADCDGAVLAVASTIQANQIAPRGSFVKRSQASVNSDGISSDSSGRGIGGAWTEHEFIDWKHAGNRINEAYEDSTFIVTINALNLPGGPPGADCTSCQDIFIPPPNHPSIGSVIKIYLNSAEAANRLKSDILSAVGACSR